MTKVRKLLAMLFCLVLVLGLLPPAPAAEAATQLTYDEVTSIVNNYYNVVTENGSKTAYWNANIRSNGTATLKKQADAGEYAKAVTYKSCGLTASTQTHGNGCTSNLFKGVGSVDSSGKLDVTAADAQCSGFAAYMEYVIFKTTSLSSFTVYGGSKALPSNYEVKPGDQVRYSGHSYVIYKVSGDKAYIIECNYPSGSCAIHKGTKSVSTIKSQSYNGSTSFYISSPAVKLQTYTVSYDANGGTGAPASQTKTEGVALTLSNEVPTRASVSDGSYTVTLNPNGGSVSSSSLTAQKTACYSFFCWNTAADGSGTS